MSKAPMTWLIDQYESRTGSKPHLCDVIEQGDQCIKLGRHQFDPLTEWCVRCGSRRHELEEQP